MSNTAAVETTDRQEAETRATMMERARRSAWIVVVIVDAGFVVWGGMAALVPEYLLGPGSMPILPAGYEGFTNASWSELVQTSSMTAAYMTLLFRTYGAYCVAFSLPAIALAATAFRRGDPLAWWGLLLGNTIALASAMRYDWLASAIGPFEMTEYLGLALVWAAHAVTAPCVAASRLRPLGTEK